MPMRPHVPIISCALALAVACQGGGSPPPSDAAIVRARLAEPDGMRVFALYCASCHGESGSAPGAPPVMGPGALSGYQSEAELYRFVAARMPSKKPLPDADARAVSRYLAIVAGWQTDR